MGIYNPSEGQSSYIPKVETSSTVEEIITTTTPVLVIPPSDYTVKAIIHNAGDNIVGVCVGVIIANQPVVPAFYLKPGGTFIDEYPAFQGGYHVIAIGGNSIVRATPMLDAQMPE